MMNDTVASKSEFVELLVPLPIQLFLWRQTSPFIRPKLGKLHETTCVFCQNSASHHEMKEASKCLEKVLVQNILFGLSPSITQSISSMTRWGLARSALPFVLHCTASLLINRKESNIQGLGLVESKLLYTLHWLLLDAAGECRDDSNKTASNPFQYVYPIAYLQVFFYLFAPIMRTLKSSDFNNVRLESGLKLWSPLWQHRHPDIPCFTTPARPIDTVAETRSRCRFQGSDTETLELADGYNKNRASTTADRDEGNKSTNSVGLIKPPNEIAPGASNGTSPTSPDMSSRPTNEKESSTVNGRDLLLPETIPEEVVGQSDTEHVMIIRLDSAEDEETFNKPNVYKVPSEMLGRRIVCGSRLLKGASESIEEQSSMEIDISQHGTGDESVAKLFHSDSKLATLADVAIVRCLFVSRWLEEGIFWSLQFLYHRLCEVSGDNADEEPVRKRSNSLPVPKIQVSIYTTPENQQQKQEEEERGQTIISDSSYITESPFLTHQLGDLHKRSASTRSSKSMKGRKRMADLRAFVETKLWSKSQTMLEKLAHERRRASAHILDTRPSSAGGASGQDLGYRPHSSLDKRPSAHDIFNTGRDASQSLHEIDCERLVKGKSMPSLRFMCQDTPSTGRKAVGGVEISTPRPPATPIIMVTKYTPTPSPTISISESLVGVASAGAPPTIPNTTSSAQASGSAQPTSSKTGAGRPVPLLNKSFSESNVVYIPEEVHEAPGASGYVNKNGTLDLLTLLKGLHSIVQRGNVVNTLRVCEKTVALLEFMLGHELLHCGSTVDDLSATTRDYSAEKKSTEDATATAAADAASRNAVCESTHHICMDILVRMFLRMRCMHGCRAGFHGPAADFLRSQCQLLLTLLMSNCEDAFKRFLRKFAETAMLQEIVDFLHSLVGWCRDTNHASSSPLNQKRMGAKGADAYYHGYGNNFGAVKGTGFIRGVEGCVIGTIFVPFVSRLALISRELKQPENLSLYHETRQMMAHVKDHHGSVFRRALLASFFNSTDTASKQRTITTTKLVRRRQNLADTDSQGSPTSCYQIRSEADAGSRRPEMITGGRRSEVNTASRRPEVGIDSERLLRKSIFKKKTVASLSSYMKQTPSVQNVLELESDSSPTENQPIKKRARRITEKNKNYNKSRSLRIAAAVLKRDTRSYHLTEQELNDPMDKSDRSMLSTPARPLYGGKTPVRSLHRTRRRIEHQLSRIGLGKNKKRDKVSEQLPERSRHNSWDVTGDSQCVEYMAPKQCRLVNNQALQHGFKLMSVIMDSLAPGTVPDVPLIAAAVVLEGVPVVARACFYLECAHFVHRCNKGHWPNWMKLQLPIFRGSGPEQNRTMYGIRRSQALQRSAGKMFYQWAEALGAQLETILAEQKNTDTNSRTVDEQNRRQLRLEDDEEDFLDEACVNNSGRECPLALQLACCTLLYEITVFLRETYPLLPRASQVIVGSAHTSASAVPGSLSGQSRERAVSGLGALGVPSSSRRWSTALSIVGCSQSFQGGMGYGAESSGPLHVERKISFALNDEEMEGSGHICGSLAVSQGALQQQQLCEDDGSGGGARSARIAAGARGQLLKRSGGTGFFNSSVRRRSIKLRKGAKERDSDPEFVRRSDSIKSQRKVSAVSEGSAASDDHSGEDSTGFQAGCSDDMMADTASDQEVNDSSQLHLQQLPWLPLTVKLLGKLSFECRHQHFCKPECHQRVIRASNRLLSAAKQVHLSTDNGLVANSSQSKLSSRQSSSRDKSRQRRPDPNPADSPALNKRDRLQFSKETLNSDLERGGENRESGESKFVTVNKQPPPEEPAIVKYLNTQVVSLFHIPLKLMMKCSCIISDEISLKMLPITWDLLLEPNHVISSSASALFIVLSVKESGAAKDLLSKQLQHQDPEVRATSVLKFQALWQSRYQCWPRMEESAHAHFKVTQPVIEFTLPSPKIGIDMMPIVDPPWLPQSRSKVEDVTLKEELHSIVSAGKTRRKQRAELVQMALQKEDEKKRADRENYKITSVPVVYQASHEPSFYHVTADEHEDPGLYEMRYSLYENRQSSEINSEYLARIHHQHCQLAVIDEDLSDIPRGSGVTSAPVMFPGVLCAAALDVISLLEDTTVTRDGTSVCQIAHKVIWKCLVEDSALFLRYLFERLTRDHMEDMVVTLRRLIHTYPSLPSRTAFWLYNYLVGFIMLQLRSISDCATLNIANALHLIWMVVPSIQGILFKDLKQIFRKEQCDGTLLITANIPSAKRIIVHGPQGPESGDIPSQFPIQEDTQFCEILTEVREFFGIAEDEHKYYHLVDHKSGVLHNPTSYVRDFYFFKRSQYPQLSLVYIDPEEAYNTVQSHTFHLKLLEIGKALKSLAMLMRPDQVAQRVFFLHEELTKLPAFPRKALEVEFHLYRGGHLGEELYCLDRCHKLVWVRMTARMFEGMAGNFAYAGDVHLFLNVVNGCLVLHCEDSAMLRLVMATFIAAAHQFKNVFSNNGYTLIMPTILQVYNNHQANSLLCRTVEFICKQFYVLHRKPFVLQMLGSVTPILDLDTTTVFADANKIQPRSLFRLLISLETPSPDPLTTIELVSDVEEPLRALDFCYQEDTDDVTIMDVINLCVTVVAYSADSVRAHHMLNVLEAVVPLYLSHVQRTASVQTSAGPKAELKCEKEVIMQLAISMKTLLHNCEPLAKNYTGPTRGSSDFKNSSVKTFHRNAAQDHGNTALDIEDESPSRAYYSEKKSNFYERDLEDSEVLRESFRRPRDTLLNIVANFLTRTSARLQELGKKPVSGAENKTVELLDTKCHTRLADIAMSLLKVAPYDPDTMLCAGLQKYMNHVLPYPDWSQEVLKPTLLLLMRRLEKVFTKILKKSFIRRHTDWVASASLLRGVYTTLCKHPYIAHLPPLKSLIHVCQSLIIGSPSGAWPSSSVSAAGVAAGYHGDQIPGSEMTSGGAGGQPPPHHFSSTVVRLIAMQMLAQGETHSLEQVCGGSSVFPTPERTETMLISLILPLCLRVGCGRSDVPQMRQSDISFALTVMLHALHCPPLGHSWSPSAAPQGASSLMPAGSLPAINPVSATAAALSVNTSQLHSSKLDGDPHAHAIYRPAIYSIAFLGLKILTVCFERHLSLDWNRIARTVASMKRQALGGLALWDFLDFVVTYPSPLFILLLPTITDRLDAGTPFSSDSDRFKQIIWEKLAGNVQEMPTIKCKSSVLMELAHEMKLIKEELANCKAGGFDHRKSIVTDLHSGVHSRIWTASCSGSDLAKSPNTPSHHQLQVLGRHSSLHSRGGSQCQAGGVSVDSASMRVSSVRSRSAVGRFMRRTSYGGGEPLKGVFDPRAASSEPRLHRKSLFFLRKRGSKTAAGACQLDADEDLCQESTKVMSESWEGLARQHCRKLQRTKAQSRKAFRFRKSRRGDSFEMPTLEVTSNADSVAATMAPPGDYQPTTVAETPTNTTSTSQSPNTPTPPDTHTAAPLPVISSRCRSPGSIDCSQYASCAIPETIEESSPPCSTQQRRGSSDAPLCGGTSPAPVPPCWWRGSDCIGGSPTSSSAAYRESVWLSGETLCQLLAARRSTTDSGGSIGGATVGDDVSSLPGDCSSASGSTLGSDHTETTAVLMNRHSAENVSSEQCPTTRDQNTLI